MNINKLSEHITCPRGEFGDLLNVLELLGEGVEVGTYRGNLSNNILSKWNGKKLYCVDPYTVYGDMSYHTQPQFDQIYKDTKNLLSKFGNRVEIIRLPSVEGAKKFADQSLDFVYIDGDHSETAVMNDLVAWFPKVRQGGLMFGDDVDDPAWPGVRSAIEKFFKPHNLMVYKPTWFFCK